MSMRLSVPIDDTTLTKLQAIADQMGRPLEDVAGIRLKAALALLPGGGGRVVVIGGALTTLEEILGGGSILNEGDLLKKVERLAGISFLHVRLPFTPNQLEELADRAARQGKSVEDLVSQTAPRIYEQFFNLIART